MFGRYRISYFVTGYAGVILGEQLRQQFDRHKFYETRLVFTPHFDCLCQYSYNQIKSPHPKAIIALLEGEPGCLDSIETLVKQFNINQKFGIIDETQFFLIGARTNRFKDKGIENVSVWDGKQNYRQLAEEICFKMRT